MDYETILTVAHIFGVVVGMGGAFTSDAIFFSSIRDEKVSQTELRFLRLGGKMVWVGLLFIAISGALLFIEDYARLVTSAKFLAKMSIVGIIILNGLVFHLIHLPRFHRHANRHFPSSEEFMKAVPLLLVGGVVSTISWFSALVLGMWRGVPYSYIEIISTYVAIVVVVSMITVLMKRKFIPH